jgi:hypothetical protein
VRWLILLGLCTGCDQLFGILEVSVPADAPGDAITDTVVSEPDVLGDATVITCPGSYGSFPMLANKYRYGTGKAWLDAELACENDRGTATGYTHLVVIAEDTERSYVNTYIAGNGNIAWIGVTDIASEGTWLWVSNEPTPTGYPSNTVGASPWGASEPNGSTNENCVEIVGNADFNDYDCTQLLPFVCECDTHAPAPANYTAP